MSMDLDVADESSDLSSVESEAAPTATRRSTRTRAAAKGKQRESNDQPSENTGLPRRRRAAAAATVRAQTGSKTARTGRDTTRNVSTSRGNEDDVEDTGDEDEGAEERVEQRVEDDDLEGSSESEDIDNEDEDDEDFAAPGTRAAAGGGGGRRGARDSNRRASSGVGARGGGRRPAATRPQRVAKRDSRRRNAEDAADDEAEHADGVENGGDHGQTRGKDDFRIESDNNLFNAIRDPRSALAATVEDWIDLYQGDEDSRGQALAELVNMMLRACGCNLSVDRHEAQDLDGIVDKLEDIQTDLAKVNQASYPLIARSKAYKKFHASLREFVTRLIEGTAASEILYDDVFCETLQSWLVAASSSKLRAVRHTSTVLALLLVEALCSMSKEVNEDLAALQRSKEAEVRKQKTATNTRTRGGIAAASDKSKLKDLEARLKAQHAKKTRIEDQYFKDVFDGVFVHRFRDAVVEIRMECIRSLGRWMDILPEFWLEGSYLRYIGWLLTDLSKEVRHEAVASLTSLYNKDDYINNLQHFTERFKGRLVEMASCDSELSIRTSAISALMAIDRHGLLEDEQREELALCLYDADGRVRKAVAPFIAILLQEAIERVKEDEAMAAQLDMPIEEPTGESVEQKQMNLKCLATILVKLARSLEEKSAQGGVRTVADNQEAEGAGDVSAAWITQLVRAAPGQSKDRITAAVESLWNDVPLVRDWQAMLAYLLLDHAAVSGTHSVNTAQGRSISASAAASDSQTQLVADASGRPSASQDRGAPPKHRLNDQEELLLLCATAASIRNVRVKVALMPAKDDEEREQVFSETTRALMHALPRLLGKHQTDVAKSTAVLALPQQMSLGLYLDMRLVTQYENLWEDVIKQFTNNSDVFLLEKALETIRYMLAEQSLGRTNSEQKTTLETIVVGALRQAIHQVDLQSVSLLRPETIDAISNALLRITLLSKSWDIVDLMEESDRDTPDSVVDIARELLTRAELGIEAEDKTMQRAMEVLYMYFLWKAAKLSQDESEELPGDFLKLRDELLDVTTSLALAVDNAASDAVRRSAFKTMLDLRIMCKSSGLDQQGRRLEELSIESQYRCAGFIQAEIEKRVTSLRGHNEEEELIREQAEEDDEQVQDSDEERQGGPANGAPSAKERRPQTTAEEATEYAFNDLIVTFSRAVCTDVIDLHHSSTVLSHYGRLGAFYDECAKVLGETLRLAGVQGQQGNAVAGVVVESLKNALNNYLRSASSDDSTFTALAKHLHNHIVLRGKGFAIAARLPSKDLLKIHQDLIGYALEKASVLESQERRTSRNKSLVVFKALNLLILGVTGKEAQLLHAHMDKCLREFNIVPSMINKAWDAQRAYAKRLVTIMSKEPSLRAAARRQVKSNKATESGVADDGNAGAEHVDEESEAEGDDGDNASTLPSRKRRRAKPSAGAARKTSSQAKARGEGASQPTLPTRKSGRTAASAAVATYAEDEDDDSSNGESQEDEEAAERETPRSRTPQTQRQSTKAAAPGSSQRRKAGAAQAPTTTADMELDLDLDTEMESDLDDGQRRDIPVPEISVSSPPHFDDDDDDGQDSGGFSRRPRTVAGQDIENDEDESTQGLPARRRTGATSTSTPSRGSLGLASASSTNGAMVSNGARSQQGGVRGIRIGLVSPDRSAIVGRLDDLPETPAAGSSSAKRARNGTGIDADNDEDDLDSLADVPDTPRGMRSLEGSDDEEDEDEEDDSEPPYKRAKRYLF